MIGNDDILWKIDSEIGKDKEVVKLKREIEDLINSNNHWKRKCSEMSIALKTYEEGRYQEHLENKRLNNIIEKLERLVDDYAWNSYYIKCGNRYLKSEILNDIREIIELKGSDK